MEPVPAQAVYGDIALRTFCDLDILVMPEKEDCKSWLEQRKV
jgi:hypothetical protein